ncbi:MAG: site-2 protease family protein [Saprospiraceae bacterium]|nr:site-2 protease family protein [Saprospiraceae bacterium]
MFEKAWYIGSFAKIPVKIHWTFLLIVLYVIGTGLSEGASNKEILIEVCFILTMFMCVVLHEFGHALTAKRYGIKTEDIILLPIGGVARLRNMPEKPIQELVVAIMGPMVNVVIALLLFIVLSATMDFNILNSGFLESIHFGSWSGFLPLLMLSNIMLVLFNMIPAFPMDGGRVLRALLSMNFGRLKATRIASLTGQAICIVLIAVGLYYGAYTLALIGVFIFFSASQEYRSVAMDAALKNKTVRNCYQKDVPVLTEYQDVKSAYEFIMHYPYQYFPVINLLGNYSGWVSSQQIKNGIKQNPELKISDISHKTLLSIHPDTTLTNALYNMQGSSEMLLVSENEQVLGTIDRFSIQQLMSGME